MRNRFAFGNISASQARRHRAANSGFSDARSSEPTSSRRTSIVQTLRLDDTSDDAIFASHLYEEDFAPTDPSVTVACNETSTVNTMSVPPDTVVTEELV